MEEIISLNGKSFKIQYSSLKEKTSILSEIEALQTNLVQNPGFETVSPTAQYVPANWFNGVDSPGWIFPYNSPQDLPGRSGKGAAIIRTTSGKAYWGQHIAGLSSSANYTLTGWAMTTNVVGSGAFLEVDWFDASNNYISGSASTSTPISGSTSWTQLSVTSASPSNAAAANVILILVGTGTAVFDDISFVSSGGGGGCGACSPSCPTGTCSSGYTCSNGTCIPVGGGGCSPPCPVGYACQGTTCVPTGGGGCSPPCPVGYTCQGTTCVPVGGGGGATCTNCDPITNYCVAGTCIKKTYVLYGGIAFGALFVLSLLKK